MKSKEEEDDSYAEDFDNLDDEKNPFIVKDRDSSKRKRSLVGKVTHEMYKVFDEACKDINITTGVIQISDNARKVYFYLQFQDFPNDLFSFLKGLEKAANDIGRELSRGMASAEKEINKAYNSVRTSPLLLKSLKKAGDQIGKDISRGVNAASKEINRAVHGAVVVDNFRTGNQLQLVSRASGRTLQIVTSQNGQIIPDGNGMEGPQAANAVWIVTDLKNNIVTLHNKNNFLCIVGGQTCLRYFPDTNQAGREAHFRVVQVQNNFVCLESIIEPGRHVGVHNNGQLKSAVATGREIEGQFGVRLIYSPYPPNPDPQHAKAATYQAPPPSYPGYVVAPPGAAAASGQTTVTQGSGVTVVQTTYPPAGPPPYKK